MKRSSTRPRQWDAPATAQPVLDAIARTAARLCEANDALIFQVQGDRIRWTAKHGRLRAAGEVWDFPLNRASVVGRAVVDRRAVHIHDLARAVKTAFPDARAAQRATGVRTILAAPLLRDGTALGTIVVRRTRVRPFTAKQIALLKTFADQAAIAIENARLSAALTDQNRELTSALERETATGAILKTISGSPTELQPVLDMIAANSVRLCGGLFSSVYRFDGDLIHMEAHDNYPPRALEESHRLFPARPTRGLFTGRAILERAVVHVPDVERDAEHGAARIISDVGFRSVLSVPMLRDGEPIGAITVWRATLGPFSDAQIALLKTFADQAVIAIENVRLFKELQTRNRALTESLEQQTATSATLRVISSSPTDLEPVARAIADSVGQLCDCTYADVFRFDGELIHWVASHGRSDEQQEVLRNGWPRRPGGDTLIGQTVLGGGTLHLHDAAADPHAVSRVALSIRTFLGVPMLRSGQPVGVIGLTRSEVRPFSDREIALVQTFADQAVIAIENVRLFTELQQNNEALTRAHARVTEALEQQTATSDILRVISGSPTDVRPVFDVILDSALRLCGAERGIVFTYDGDRFVGAAARGLSAEAEAEFLTRLVRPAPHSGIGRMVAEKRPVHIADVRDDIAYQQGDPLRARTVNLLGARTAMWLPLLKGDTVIGALAIYRQEVRPFTDEQIALVQTFADQAVIAIENVRLFTELEARNRALTAALDQQTATSEILRVISRSQTDIQPVFDTIVQSAGRLCDAVFSALFRFDGELVHFVAHHNFTPERVQAFRRAFPMPPSRETATARAILERRIVHVPDMLVDAEHAQHLNSRSLLVVPLMGEGTPIGTLNVGRAEPGAFTESQIELLKTFADQAVIAIENARLLSELQEKNLALTESNEQVTEALDRQTATADVLRIIAQSPTELQPVLDAIAASAVRLCAASDAVIERLEGDHFYNAAHAGVQMQGLVGLPLPLTRRFPGGRAVLDRQPVIIDDIHLVAEREYPDTLALLELNTIHSVAEIPLLSEGKPLGTIAVLRAEVRPFTEAEVALLQTFADQAVIAIENVRLFTELEAKNRDLTTALDQQTATSAILRVISSSPTDAQPVFDTIARSALRLLDGHSAAVRLLAGDALHVRASTSTDAEGDDALARESITSLSASAYFAQVVQDRTPAVVDDMETDPRIPPEGRVLARARGFRSGIGVPMLREESVLGLITVTRREPGPFSKEETALLKIFADQAVIAIENVRLFKELEARNRDITEALEQQTATAEILRLIGTSPTDAQPVFDGIAGSAVRVLDALACAVFVIEGEAVSVAATHGVPGQRIERFRTQFPAPLSTQPEFIETIREGIFHLADIEHNPAATPEQVELARLGGYRTRLMAPMMRGDGVLGVIAVTRLASGPFPPSQVELLKTFADQAVIAIENVRLFKELESRNRDLTTALDRETATSEILGVISSSPTDVQPVFDAIVESAVTLCGARLGAIYRREGDLVHLVGLDRRYPEAEAVRATYPAPVTSALVSCRAIHENAVIHLPDTETVGALPPEGLRLAQLSGFRSVVAVPMRREDDPIGAILVGRPAEGPFPDEQIALLQTFADQAVIAIENVRLFKELESRNSELSTALDRQTATSEILRVISRSQTDLQPVFEVIAENARRLFRASWVSVFRYDGEFIELVAERGGRTGTEPMPGEHARSRLRPSSMRGRAIVDRAVVQVADILTDPSATETGRRIARAAGWRASLLAPMIRDGQPIGVIAVTRAEPGAFASMEVELLQTFADQAVIAVENARLLNELQARTAQLSRSVDELTALGEVSRALSSTLDLEAVLNTIVARANQLVGTDSCSVWEYDEATEAFSLLATENRDEEVVAVTRRAPIRKGEGVQGRMAETRAPVQVADIVTEGAYQGPLRDVLLRTGTRALLAIPLLRDDRLVGGLTVNRKTPGEFSPETVELLKTFATQSALAINNARLFREIEDKSRQLEIASLHKSQFLANMSHELRTPLNAILGYTELIVDNIYGEVPERMREVLERVDKSGRHLLGLINDILDLSKIEAGQLTLALGPYAMDAVAQTVATQVGALAAEKQLGFETELAEGLPIGQGDERRLTQVLLNLVGNAIKFTDAGKIVVRVGTSGNAYVVSVTDTGPGIAEADREKIFEEFQQADTTRAKAKGGTGLGLAISRRIVEMHGGRLWVDSTLGEGSTFSFTVPVHVEHQVAVGKPGAPR